MKHFIWGMVVGVILTVALPAVAGSPRAFNSYQKALNGIYKVLSSTSKAEWNQAHWLKVMAKNKCNEVDSDPW